MSCQSLLHDEDPVEREIIRPPYDAYEDEERTNPVSVTGPAETTRRHRVVLLLVFSVLLFERIGYYSLNYELDLLIFHMQYGALLIMCLRAGGQFILPLVGAWFGECLFGVHTTAVFGTVLEFIGGSLLLGSGGIRPINSSINTTVWIRLSSTNDEPISDSLVLGGLVLVMLGLSLTRSNYLMLAAAPIPELKLVETGFFRWYFFAVSVGQAIAIGGLSWTTNYIQAVCWPLCFLVALVLLLVVKCVSKDQLNQTSRKGFRKLLECLSCCRSSEDDEPLARLKGHMTIVFLFIGMQLPYFFLYATLDVPVVYGYTNKFLLVVRNLYEPVSIILILLVIFLVRPIVKNRFNASSINSLKLIALGMLFMTASCLFTALFDQFTHDIIYDGPLCVGGQAPQFFMIGLSQVLAYLKALEFVYVESLKHLKNQMLGIYLTVIGLGYCTSLGFVPIVRPKFFGEPLQQRVIDLSIVGGFQLMCFIPFVVFFRKYKYRSEYEQSVSAAIDGTRRRVFGGSVLEDSLEDDDCSCC